MDTPNWRLDYSWSRHWTQCLKPLTLSSAPAV